MGLTFWSYKTKDYTWLCVSTGCRWLEAGRDSGHRHPTPRGAPAHQDCHHQNSHPLCPPLRPFVVMDSQDLTGKLWKETTTEHIMMLFFKLSSVYIKKTVKTGTGGSILIQCNDRQVYLAKIFWFTINVGHSKPLPLVMYTQETHFVGHFIDEIIPLCLA